ncbi:hypothetical protein BC739_007279 [Kutzneria viridogrisea]|uniref:DUF3152 domain-containing protein n=1 Tax=Kutzneria viridogrisea TaxID=47990 RepID=A0ABR6BT18_9PSEU|nr:DUF3152 domain-containing protein [Kutzneria albida]MBA8930046.1 hypothetical protein [Kutzneria viridogrisea]
MTRTTQEGRDGEGEQPKPPAKVSPIRPAVTRRPPEDRYRSGSRRTSAQPLAASWRPSSQGERPSAGKPARAGGKRGVARFAATYGWRVYALPVLVVVTALVVFNVARAPSDSTTGTEAAGTTTAGPPVATEGKVQPVDPKTGTAVLPPGDAFPQAGTGTWHGVVGDGKKVGTGPKLYHYGIAVEDGIDPAAYGGDDAFAKTVESILSDSRSWVGQGTISLQRVGPEFKDPDFIVSLTTPNTDHRPDMCGFQIQFEASCWNPSQGRVVINLARWVRGAAAFNGDMGLYRQYAINHEVGHVFGNNHRGCETQDGLAPVMMQQTFGVSDDYVWQLNQVDPFNKSAVPKDGKTCKPNAWPNPQSVPGAQQPTQ